MFCRTKRGADKVHRKLTGKIESVDVIHGDLQQSARDRVLVGMGAIIMDGVVVERDVIIGAGTLVLPGRTLESGYLYVGSPARQARRLTESDLEFFSYTANKYVELKNRYLAAAD